MANTWAELSTKATYSKEDCVGGPILVTIKGFGEKTFKDENDKPTDTIKCVFVSESDRVIPLKEWGLEFFRDVYPAGPDTALGQVIELFHDPDVKFGGKKTGGLRIRKPTSEDKF